jgi:hypothetical protein
MPEMITQTAEWILGKPSKSRPSLKLWSTLAFKSCPPAGADTAYAKASNADVDYDLHRGANGQLDGLRTKGIASSFEARTQTPVNDQDRSGWRRTPSGRRRARSEDREHMSRLLNDR